MWELLGHAPCVAHVVWPEANPALLVQDSVTCVVQVDGKVRDKFDVAPSATEAELEALAMATAGVVRTLEGREVANVIVRAPKIVSITTKSKD
jgi:leucyl-tRNA synthetase